MSGGGVGGVIAVGACGGPDGLSKAAVLTLNTMGEWQPTLLPGLGTDPAAGHYESYGHMEDIAFGVAEDDDGNDKPVVWSFDAALQTWNSPIELPLLPGGMQGLADNGLVFDDAGTAVSIVVGTSETGGGGGLPATHAAYWLCNHTDDDCDLPGSWTVTDLGALPGLNNSRASGIVLREDDVYAMVGASDDGLGNEVATLWEADTNVTPAAVTVDNLNSLVSNLPSNITLTEAFSITGRGTVATGRIETGSVSAAGVGGPHAFFLATVCTANADCDDGTGCTFEQCIDSVCTGELSRYGDIASTGGICGPDGSIDLTDILGVLDGFAGTFRPGCERVNVDIAGDQGSCDPNDSIDLSDILAVLDAFQGQDNCCAEGG